LPIDQTIIHLLGHTAQVRDARRFGMTGDVLWVVDAAPDGEANRYLLSSAEGDAPRYQSAMNLARPERLLLHYEQLMALAFLLSDPSPRSALLLGLGGGAMYRHIRRVHPTCAVTAVECSATVIDIAQRWFAVDTPIIEAKADSFLAGSQCTWDAILVDLYDARGASAQSIAFWKHCAARLSPTGILAVNWADFHGLDGGRATADTVETLLPHCLYVADGVRRDNIVQFCSPRRLPTGDEIEAGLPGPATLNHRRVSLARCVVGARWPS